MKAQTIFRSLGFTFLTLVLCGVASAQKVHLVLVGDIHAPDVAASVKEDLARFEQTMKDGIKDSDLVVHNFTDTVAVAAEIDNLAVDKKDTVVFYYSGHGAVQEKEGPDNRQQYFTPVNQKTNKIKYINKPHLVDRISKKTHLTVVLTDTCSTSRLLEKVEGYMAVAPEEVELKDITYPLFDKLFFKANGVVDITAAVGLAYTFQNLDGKLLYNGQPVSSKYGSIFTLVLTEKLAFSRDDSKIGWKEFFDTLFDGVAETSQNYAGKVQKPHAFSLGENYVPPTPEALRSDYIVGIQVTNRDDKNGVTVSEVFEGRRAAEAGIQKNDVILEVDGKKITDVKTYFDAVDDAGDVLNLNVKRGSETVTIQIQLTKPHTDDPTPTPIVNPTPKPGKKNCVLRRIFHRLHR
jgi:hypothetical protein